MIDNREGGRETRGRETRGRERSGEERERERGERARERKRRKGEEIIKEGRLSRKNSYQGRKEGRKKGKKEEGKKEGRKFFKEEKLIYLVHMLINRGVMQRAVGPRWW
jgi:hypothetical protein